MPEPTPSPSGTGLLTPARRPAVIELRSVRAGYGRIEVLHGIDLSLPAGAVLALLGPNGAGKSTVLKVASGLLAPMDGCFHVMGRHVNGVATDALARAGVCTIPEGRAVFPNLTVSENLRIMTYGGVSRGEVEARAFARFPRLAERRKQLAGTLSGGEQQMLAMARALATEPAALLLDEISMGLAPLVVDDLYAVVGQIAAEGVAILLTEQFARAAMRVADRVALVSGGRIAAVGRPDELPSDLAAAYLGGGLTEQAS
ncbi:MAG: ABC transporter ATP-binding protein [Acidobacteriota bacterium]|nr:ABC transporter ATP-binding protein [Acidobacteriota bacterium]